MTTNAIEYMGDLLVQQILMRTKGDPILREDQIIEQNLHKICLRLEELGIATQVCERTGNLLDDFDLESRINRTSNYVVWKINRTKATARLNTLQL